MRREIPENVAIKLIEVAERMTVEMRLSGESGDAGAKTTGQRFDTVLAELVEAYRHACMPGQEPAAARDPAGGTPQDDA